MTDKRVTDYCISELGLDSEQFFPGVSTVFTKWTDAYFGIGHTNHDAYADALEQAAIDGWNVDQIPACDWDLVSVPEDTDTDDYSECHEYVAIHLM